MSIGSSNTDNSNSITPRIANHALYTLTLYGDEDTRTLTVRASTGPYIPCQRTTILNICLRHALWSRAWKHYTHSSQHTIVYGTKHTIQHSRVTRLPTRSLASRACITRLSHMFLWPKSRANINCARERGPMLA